MQVERECAENDATAIIHHLIKQPVALIDADDVKHRQPHGFGEFRMRAQFGDGLPRGLCGRADLGGGSLGENRSVHRRNVVHRCAPHK
jgi:hypothetical protein